MSDLRRCSQGHVWDVPPNAPAAGGTVCPSCGATVSTVPCDDPAATLITVPSIDDPGATGLYEPAREPSGVDAEKASASESKKPSKSSRNKTLQIPGYEILGELGRGGMGVVYKARQVGLNRLVALKMVLAGAHAGEEELLRFRAEAEAVARLKHASIVQIYDIGEHEGRPYFALEFVDGGTLAQKLGGTPLPPREAAQLTELLAQAVACAHEQGVVHRDLKPANVLLSGEGRGVSEEKKEGSSQRKRPNDSSQRSEAVEVGSGERGVGSSARSSRGLFGRKLRQSNSSLSTSHSSLTPKITDFGLAKQMDTDSSQTKSGTIMGTPSYMAPEQAAGLSKDIGPAADIYSLGAMLYEMLVGRPPFRAATMLETLEQVRSQEPVAPSRLQPGLPSDLTTICLKCLAKDSAKRYPTAIELASDLRRFLNGEAIMARPAGAVEKSWRWCRRNPALAITGGLAVSALIAATALSVTVAVHQTNFADEQTKAAGALRSEKEKTQTALDESRRLSSSFALDRGVALAERGATSHALLWFARSLQIAPDGADDLKQAIRMNLGTWQRSLTPLRAAFHSPGWLVSAPVCADGRTLIVPTAGSDSRICDIISGRVIGKLPSYATLPFVSLSGDGRRAALAERDAGQVQVFDTVTGLAIGQPLVTPGPIRMAMISPDSQQLLTAETDDKLRLFDLATNRLVRESESSIEKPLAIRFSPDGRSFITIASGAIRLWQTATVLPVSQPFQHAAPLRLGQFSGDGRIILTYSADGIVKLWKFDSGELIGQELQTAVGSLAVGISPDGKTFVVENQLWSAETGERIAELVGHRNQLRIAVFSPDSQLLLTSSTDGTGRFWETATGKPLFSPLEVAATITSAVFSPDGRSVTAVDANATARLWELNLESTASQSFPHAMPIRAVAFSPDGRSLLTCGGSEKTASKIVGEARFCDFVTGQQINDALAHEQPVSAVVFTPDGKIALTAGNLVPTDPMSKIPPPGGVWLWDTQSQRQINHFQIHESPISGAAISPDGRIAVTAGSDGMARVWFVESGQPALPPLAHSRKVLVVKFSPDGKTIATGCADHKARLWDAETGQPLGTPMPHQDWVTELEFTPDGKLLLTGSDDKTLRAWNLQTCSPVGSPLVHGNSVSSITVSSDSRTILSGCEDGAARFWDLATGKALGKPLIHEGFVRAVAFDRTGEHVRTASFNGPRDQLTVRHWRAPTRMDGSEEQIGYQAQLITGLELDDSGAVRVLSASEWEERRLRIDSNR